VFDGDRYFDVFVEYAKADVEDILVKITARNRGPAAAPFISWPTTLVSQHVVVVRGRSQARVQWRGWTNEASSVAYASTARPMALAFSISKAEPRVLFTENESNNERLFGLPMIRLRQRWNQRCSRARFVSMGSARRPREPRRRRGFAASSPGGSFEVRLRQQRPRFHELGRVRRFRRALRLRKREADEFYDGVIPTT